MQKKVLIDGMMCPHCEAHMKRSLEAIEGVVSASPSHADKCAILDLSRDVSEEELKNAVAAAGYTYLGIEG
ncbi:MAG: cation transporter [Mailhella sp.]|nr:cation transporter [Mailhella sp.]